MSDFLTATLVCLESNRGRESPPATLNLGTIVMDNQPMLDLVFRTRFRWKLQLRHMTGDTKYGTIENIKALEDVGIRERTNAGLVAARSRGRVGGRPRKLKTNGKVALARQMFAGQSHSIPEICTALGISRATLYRYVKEGESPTQ